MDKEELAGILELVDTERKAEYMQKLIKTEVQTALNLSNDRRIVTLTPHLIATKKAQIEAMMKILEMRVEKLDALINAIAGAFGVIQGTLRLAVINPLLLIFWGVVLADLIGKQLIYTNAIFELEGLILDEIYRPLEEYYIIIPPVEVDP